MIEIKQHEGEIGIMSSFFFERTDNIRERIVDCSREELMDLAFSLVEVLEKQIHNAEQAERILGWRQ